MSVQKVSVLAAVVVTSLIAVPSLAHPIQAGKPGSAAGDVIRRGAPIEQAPVLALDEVVRNPERYAGTTITVEGRVGRVCQMKGCWMGLVPEGASSSGVRVTFKNYGFFVPTDSAGVVARVQGMLHTKVLSKEEADHLESEGAELTRNDDGTVTELSFVADGVELRKSETSD